MEMQNFSCVYLGYRKVISMINRFFGIHDWMDKQTRKRAIKYKVTEVISASLAIAVIAVFVL